MAAEHAAPVPAFRLAEMVAGLSDQQRRLDLLEVIGDPRTSVCALLCLSYQAPGHRSAEHYIDVRKGPCCSATPVPMRKSAGPGIQKTTETQPHSSSPRRRSG